ncbi:MAG: slipin family protein [Candidatus Gastranaerophilales bacterium]|nr:slipin family protein [Candidatus Gastranaerophilales bacterium]
MNFEFDTEQPTVITTAKSYARPTEGHISLGTGLRAMISLALNAAYVLAAIGFSIANPAVIPILVVIGIIYFSLINILVSGVRIAAQWEKAVVLRFGHFHKIKGPGVLYVIPFIDYAKFVDLRILTQNIPSQSVITKDNVPVAIDGVLFFQVSDPQKAIISIQDYRFAISQYAQNSLRDIVGGLSLDEVLSERERIQMEICKHFQEMIKDWGIDVNSVRILDIQMPEDLKRVMSRQASAEREKRATIIKAEGDKMASYNLTEAAKVMHENEGAMMLRTLQTIDGLGASPSNTVILFPVELMSILEKFKQTDK